MPTIKIQRSSEYANRFRNMLLFLDGVEVAKIANGVTIELEVEKGVHTLIAKIDWATSNEVQFEIKEQTLSFELTGTNPFLALYYITFGRDKYLNLKEK